MAEKRFTVSITWGRSCTYHPFSMDKICWDGYLDVQNGSVQWLDQLNYRFVMWSQVIESTKQIYNIEWPPALRTVGTYLKWKSETEPGDPGSLEGIRFEVSGDENTVITLHFAPLTVQFKLGELLEREYLRYHAGKKYAGHTVSVYLGMDARKRLSRAQHLKALEAAGQPGYLLMPEDFVGGQKACYHAVHGVQLDLGKSIGAEFPLFNFDKNDKSVCRLRLQISGMMGYKDYALDEPVTLSVKIGDSEAKVSYIFTTMAHMPKLEDVYVDIPYSAICETGNRLEITYLEGKSPLLVHRVFIDADKPSLAFLLNKMPALPGDIRFHTGLDTDMLTPANGDIDDQLDMMQSEELGDFLLFHYRAASAPDEDVARWCDKMKRYNFQMTTGVSWRPEAVDLFENLLGEQFLGRHAHEISNLAYGWGEPEPMEVRKGRTLPQCKASYLNRMKGAKVVGQAIAQQYMDYEAGVETVITEIPGSHCSLLLSAARGAARAFDKDAWGVHVANHVQKIPLDADYVRRLFIVTAQGWLYGAKYVYDEEVAMRYFHDTNFAFSDELPTAYRKIYQSLYHYGNAIDLGEEVIPTGFLQGNYDILVAGCIAGPYIPKPKFWGMFGPESEGWDYDTPESGWKLVHSYLPGAHLSPIEQDLDELRVFYSGTPYGQIDLVPITSGAKNLSRYETLILPGWNTMEADLYENLIAYVQGGGHLVLCAAQCTEHITRDFLVEKQDFAFYNGGDLSRLAGVKVTAPEGIVNTVRFADEEVFTDPGVPGLGVELCGATVLAADQDGKPVLVENCIGAGKVWMMTVGEYWGHNSFDALRKTVCRRVAAAHPLDVSIWGSDEVEYHHYRCGSFDRVVLLNTDWTSSENRKHILLQAGDQQMPISVCEGKMHHVLFAEQFAVGFDVPSAVVDDFVVTETSATFTLAGCDDVAIQLFSGKAIASVLIDGQAVALCGNDLTVSMSEQWSECKVEVVFE